MKRFLHGLALAAAAGLLVMAFEPGHSAYHRHEVVARVPVKTLIVDLDGKR